VVQIPGSTIKYETDFFGQKIEVEDCIRLLTNLELVGGLDGLRKSIQEGREPIRIVFRTTEATSHSVHRGMENIISMTK
jgi:hypothetical protein